MMVGDWLILCCGAAVIGCGLASGFFLTFSDFLMTSLAAARPSAGIEAMQMINRKVYKSLLVGLLWTMFVAAPALFFFALLSDAPGSSLAWISVGGVSYFLAAFVVTFVFNVPMNEALDVMDYDDSETTSYWRRTYVPTWTFWNYFRAIGTGLAAIAYLLAVVELARGS